MPLEILKKSIAWVKSYNLGKKVHKITKTFPDEEKYDLVKQMNRAATSISMNIAEGKGRNSKKELRHYLYMAKGSCTELATQLSFAHDFGYINTNEFNELKNELIEVLKILSASINTLNKNKHH